MTPLLLLYRPRLPGLRAQSVQVAHMAHALAGRGYRVTLLADRGPGATTSAAALAALGLTPRSTLDLQLSPYAHKGLAGWWFRRRLAAWWAGPPGLVLARDLPRLAAAIARHGPRHRVVVEAHGLDSLLDVEAGRDPAAALAREASAVSVAHALVTNCGGTMAAWRASGHPLPPLQQVVHNGTAVRPASVAVSDELRCVGSLRAYKGVGAIRAAAPHLSLPLVWIGGTDHERAAAPPTANLTLRAPVPHPMVGATLAGARAVLVPLADNPFGRQLTSPLKLWDALASGRPIVAPALPTIDEIAALTGRPMHRYQPGDVASLVDAVRVAAAAPASVPVVRSWDDRAAELDALFARLLEPG